MPRTILDREARERAKDRALELFRHLDRLLGHPQNFESTDRRLQEIIMEANRLLHEVKHGRPSARISRSSRRNKPDASQPITPRLNP